MECVFTQDFSNHIVLGHKHLETLASPLLSNWECPKIFELLTSLLSNAMPNLVVGLLSFKRQSLKSHNYKQVFFALEIVDCWNPLSKVSIPWENFQFPQEMIVLLGLPHFGEKDWNGHDEVFARKRLLILLAIGATKWHTFPRNALFIPDVSSFFREKFLREIQIHFLPFNFSRLVMQKYTRFVFKWNIFFLRIALTSLSFFAITVSFFSLCHTPVVSSSCVCILHQVMINGLSSTRLGRHFSPPPLYPWGRFPCTSRFKKGFYLFPDWL